jgi:Asp-tRNA(Asn)/Glu-tRNA(Gln) amidotransferase A subunit family amidase
MSLSKSADWIGPFAGGVATVLFARFALALLCGGFNAAKKSLQRLRSVKPLQAVRERRARQIDDALAWARSSLNGPSPTPAVVATVHVAKIVDLVENLKRGEFSCVTLLKVFIINAVEAHRKTNCVTEILLADAIRDAVMADEKYAAARASGNPSAVGFLEGIPISIKDSLDVAGCDSTCGLVSRINRPASEDAALVTLLRRAGAIIFVKTNVPALLLSYECDSNVFGISTNPFNGANTPGGSSGGEGALIALKGCAAGIGTDIGGSIRIPAHFCGICGLKPSMSRVALRGSNPKGGQEGVAPVAGPMARSVRDLTALFRALTPGPTYPAGIDGMVNSIPFQEDLYVGGKSKKHLRVAYYYDDGFVPAAPACKRAVLEVVEALTRDGHECVLWTPPNATDVISTFFQLLSADGGKTLKENLSFDPPNGVVAPLLTMASVPDSGKKIISRIVSVTVDPVFGRMLGAMVSRTVDEYYGLLYKRNCLRHEFAKAMCGFDFVVAPGFGIPAPMCGATTKLSFSTNYSALFNVLDLSVAVVPVTRVNPTTDVWTREAVDRAANRGMTRMVSKIYDPQQMKGLPVGVQIITPRMTEELCLAFAERVETLIAKA